MVRSGWRPGRRVGNDPLSFIAVSALLIVTALIASSLPARRAIRLDPAAALRNE